MALVRIGISPILSRASCAGISVNASAWIEGHGGGYEHYAQRLHASGTRRYPEVPSLPLPTNVREIFGNETGRFAPERSRDIAAPIILHGGDRYECSNFPTIRDDDTHVESYDRFGAISLNGTMQSNVPKPFCSRGKSTHLNMPGGQRARDGKYIAEDMQKSHHRSGGGGGPLLRPRTTTSRFNGYAILSGSNSLRRTPHRSSNVCRMNYSLSSETRGISDDDNNNKEDESMKKPTRKELVKKYMVEFGKTFIVVHIGVSLISLAGFYTAVSSGIDLMPMADYWMDMWDMELQHRELLKTSRDFALAYLIHKVMFPIRLGITLTIVPPIATWTTRVAVGYTHGPGKLSPVLKNPPVHPKSKKFTELSVNKRVDGIGSGDGTANNEVRRIKEIKDT